METSSNRSQSRRANRLRQLAKRRLDDADPRGIWAFVRGKLARQLIWASVFLLLALMIRLIPTPILQQPRQAMHWIVTHETNWGALVSSSHRALQEQGVFEEAALPSWAESEEDAQGLEQLGLTEVVRPVDDEITSSYGWRYNEDTGEESFHFGVDLACEPGTSVRAFSGGVVTDIWEDDDYGLALTVEHNDKVLTLYAHLYEVSVQEGENVETGEQIALSGQSGNVTGPHLHFEVHFDGKAVDPAPFLRSEEDGQ